MAAADNQQDLLGADNSNQNLLATGGSANDTTTTGPVVLEYIYLLRSEMCTIGVRQIIRDFR